MLADNTYFVSQCSNTLEFCSYFLTINEINIFN